MSPGNAIRYFKPGVLVITPRRPRGYYYGRGDNAHRERTIGGFGLLTGDLRPSSPVMRIIEKLAFPVLMASEDSYGVASTVHNLIVKTRPADTGKNFRHP